jgi:indole-3-glycerol phosphate synthase
MAADILDAIVSRVRKGLAGPSGDPGKLHDQAMERPRLDFRAAIEGGPRPALIAECKRRSPSKGMLRENYSVTELVKAYEAAGVSAISVLTNADFDGTLAHLAEASAAVGRTPLLRKDFIIDERQLLEAAAYGADCVLLIARILPGDQLNNLAEAARALRLQTLIEVYEEGELDTALAAQPDLLGVNSRDLATFTVDNSKLAQMAGRLPPGMPLVAESGVSTRDGMMAASAAGARAVLVGEALVTAADPASRARELLGAMAGDAR